jgi:hypothetical protein
MTWPAFLFCPMDKGRPSDKRYLSILNLSCGTACIIFWILVLKHLAGTWPAERDDVRYQAQYHRRPLGSGGWHFREPKSGEPRRSYTFAD